MRTISEKGRFAEMPFKFMICREPGGFPANTDGFERENEFETARFRRDAPGGPRFKTVSNRKRRYTGLSPRSVQGVKTHRTALIKVHFYTFILSFAYVLATKILPLRDPTGNIYKYHDKISAVKDSPKPVNLDRFHTPHYIV